MDFSYPTVLIVPLGLGLLGFIEPCTVGGHLIFLRGVTTRPLPARLGASLAFALSRTMVMGLFGAVIALIGQHLIVAQTVFWAIFGLIYVLIGLVYAFGRAGALEHRIDVAPRAWRATANPWLLGVAFGLNIPACAAPILFGLVGLAAGSGAASLGFATMAVFGAALSLPLAVLAASPLGPSLAHRFAGGGAASRWIFAAVFLLLGVWSLWFGLFVDPADWASI